MFLRTLRTLLKDPRFRSLLYSAAITLAVGTVFYHTVEGWRWLDSFYFSVITLATVGYGDFAPKTDLGKIFTVIYLFTGIGILLGFVNPIGEYIVDRRFQKMEKKKQEGKTFQDKIGFSGLLGKLRGKK
ncbi:potassium channel family protein [Methanosarcina sp.]|uniref:potassium channel family protein n=1 Tax=Methanosarcina sp. TaxID=2213 RepID=UPI003C73A6FD